MSNSKHTPNHWTFIEDGNANIFHILESERWIIGLLLNGETPTPKQLELMRRIVACVNACVGIDHPEEVIRAMRAVKAEDLSAEAIGKLKLELEWQKKGRACCEGELQLIRELIKADVNESTYDEVERRITALTRERNALLAVLEKMFEHAKLIINSNHEDYKRASELLANQKGVQP